MALAKKYRAVSTAFALAMSSLCAVSAQAHVNTHHSHHNSNSADAVATLEPQTDADSIIHYVVERLEGSGFVANDNGHGPSRYGILGESNGLSYQQVYNLTEDQAVAIYKKTFWDGYRIEQLPASMHLVAFNATIQFGPQRGMQVVAHAHGNPYLVLSEGQEFYTHLANKNPARYGGSLNVWNKRNATLTHFVDGYGLPAAMAQERAPVEEVSYHMSQARHPKLPQLPVGSAHDFQKTSLATASAPSTPHIAEAGFATEMPPSGSNIMEWIKFWFGIVPLMLAFVRALLGLDKFTRGEKRSEPKLRHMELAVARHPNIELQPKRSLSYLAAMAMPFTMPENLTESERIAYEKIFKHRVAASQQDATSNSHVRIRRNQVDIYDEQGIENALLYIAYAWGNECRMRGGSAELRRQTVEAAQRLVDEGLIPSGFRIGGIGTFYAPIRAFGFWPTPARPYALA